MEEHEKQQLLLEVCPELAQGLTVEDVDKSLLELIKRTALLQRHITVLADKLIYVLEQNKILTEQLMRVEPLLRATKEGEKV